MVERCYDRIDVRVCFDDFLDLDIIDSIFRAVTRARRCVTDKHPSDTTFTIGLVLSTPCVKAAR